MDARALLRKLEHERNMSRSAALARLLAFQVTTRGFPGPTFEHRFHSTRLYRFDAAWERARVAVEIQGGTGHRRGAHVSPDGYARDAEKLALAQLAGWQLFYATPKQVENGTASGWVCTALVRAAERLHEEAKVCQSASDGDCFWRGCPQRKDGEPKATGRHCPLDRAEATL